MTETLKVLDFWKSLASSWSFWNVYLQTLYKANLYIFKSSFQDIIKMQTTRKMTLAKGRQPRPNFLQGQPSGSIKFHWIELNWNGAGRSCNGAQSWTTRDDPTEMTPPVFCLKRKPVKMFQLESLESDFLFEMSKQKHNLSFTIQGCISEYGWICTMAAVDSDLLNKTYTERRARSPRARSLRADF